MDLITGATGFIGSRLAKILQQQNLPCSLLARRPQPGSKTQAVDLAFSQNLQHHLSGVKRVFHCAGYAHAFLPNSAVETEKHWQVNYHATRNLLEAAASTGVEQFLFLSSVKAMADPNNGDCEVGENFPGMPNTPYGLAKRAAENAVLECGARCGMQVSVLRLAMVYGAGGKGNLQRMANLVRQGFFPPIPETGNHRSLVHISDVIDAMLTVVADTRSNGKIYIITGPETASGREIFDTLRRLYHKPPCHWSVPESLLYSLAWCGDRVAQITGKRCPLNAETLDRLLKSAWYSSDRIQQELGWQPRVSLEEGLKEMLGAQTQL